MKDEKTNSTKFFVFLYCRGGLAGASRDGTWQIRAPILLFRADVLLPVEVREDAQRCSSF